MLQDHEVAGKKKEEEAQNEGEQSPVKGHSGRMKQPSMDPGSSDEGRQESMTPSSKQNVNAPMQQPPMSGITVGHDKLDFPMQFLVPRHEAESPLKIRNFIRQLSDSPIRLQNSHNNAKSQSQSNNIIQNRMKNIQLTSQPTRVPKFIEKTQQWSFDPKEEMPNTTRNLLLFMIAVIVLVLAIVYRESLLNLFQELSFSKVTSMFNDGFNYVSDSISSVFRSNDAGSNESVESVETVESVDNTAAEDVGAQEAMDASA